jgi:cytosine/adenosine deaminase-related metal-dependent hydrolase
MDVDILLMMQMSLYGDLLLLHCNIHLVVECQIVEESLAAVVVAPTVKIKIATAAKAALSSVHGDN